MSRGTVPSLPTIYLDCPYDEKDQAKLAGAKWNESVKKWFVPANLYPAIDRFNQWRPDGKVYLKCSFEEKDKVKLAGAKWDAAVNHWYVPMKGRSQVPSKFSKWLTTTTQAPACADTETLVKIASNPKKQESNENHKRGNAQDAMLLRINENMTLLQLQEECKVRGIKGVSGKNKDWLIKELGLGTLWQAAEPRTFKAPRMAAIYSTKSAVPKRGQPSTKKTEAVKAKMAASKKTVKVLIEHNKKEAVPERVPQKKMDVNKIAKAQAKYTETEKQVGVKGKKVVTAKLSSAIPRPPDLALLPRISSALTTAQLLHELLHRHPTIKGTSRKTKSWLLGELGENSVWTTNPDLSGDFSEWPRISINMTKSQLLHELMARSPTIVGLSNKSKEDLVKLAGVGSVWTTALSIKHDDSSDKMLPRSKGFELKRLSSARATSRPLSAEKKSKSKLRRLQLRRRRRSQKRSRCVLSNPSFPELKLARESALQERHYSEAIDHSIARSVFFFFVQRGSF